MKSWPCKKTRRNDRVKLKKKQKTKLVEVERETTPQSSLVVFGPMENIKYMRNHIKITTAIVKRAKNLLKAVLCQRLRRLRACCR